jgi:hypothetical protein
VTKKSLSLPGRVTRQESTTIASGKGRSLFIFLMLCVWVVFPQLSYAQAGDSPANPDAATEASSPQNADTETAPDTTTQPQTTTKSESTTEEAEILVTYKEGWKQKGASRIYDAIDGRMITNDVLVRPYHLKKDEALKKFDDGSHGDEVPNDGVPSRVLVNQTDYIGPRTAANYDDLKGLLFTIGQHQEGPQRFFDLPLISLEWDGEEIPVQPDARTTPGIYRLTSLEKRMYAFIMRDSLDITRAYQNAEGKDLMPREDTVDPPTGLESNILESRRDSKGIQTWDLALTSGKKIILERKMLSALQNSALAGSEIAGASWFPGGISAVKVAGYRSGVAGSLSSLGLQGGMPMLGGMGMGGYGGAYGGGGYGGGFRLPGGGGVPGGYSIGGPQAFTPAMGAMGFAGGF